MLGLASNRNIKSLHCDLSSNDFGAAGAHVMGSCVAGITSITGLDISNNGEYHMSAHQ